MVTEVGTWELIKGFMSWVAYPVMLLLGYLFKKQAGDIKSLQEEVDKLKVDVAVANSQIKDIREDIKDLTSVVREAERSITLDIKSLRKDILDAARR